MQNYKRKTQRGKTSETLLRQAANAVIREGKAVKTVARDLEICLMTPHRFVFINLTYPAVKLCLEKNPPSRHKYTETEALQV